MRNITYLKGDDTLIQGWTEQEALKHPGIKKTFQYDNGCFGVAAGDKQMLIVICRVEFSGNEEARKSGKNKKVQVANEYGKKFYSSREAFGNAVGSYKDYAVICGIKNKPKRLNISLVESL